MGDALDPLERELVGLFLSLPAGWQPVVVEFVRLWGRLGGMVEGWG